MRTLTYVCAAVLAVVVGSPASAQLSSNPQIRTKQLTKLLDMSISASSVGGQTPLGELPCNPERHRETLKLFAKHGIPVTGIGWGWDLKTFSKLGDNEFNVAQGCEDGKREITLRPFFKEVALAPKVLDLFADIIATDFKSDAKRVRPAIEQCFLTGKEYGEDTFNFSCETPTATAYPLPTDHTLDYRLMIYKSGVKDFDE